MKRVVQKYIAIYTSKFYKIVNFKKENRDRKNQFKQDENTGNEFYCVLRSLYNKMRILVTNSITFMYDHYFTATNISLPLYNNSHNTYVS